MAQQLAILEQPLCESHNKQTCMRPLCEGHNKQTCMRSAEHLATR
jgi:hypothetical protein